MEISKNIINVEKLKINMEIEHKEKMQDQEKLLRRVFKAYYMNLAKNEVIETRKVEEEITNKTKYILDYTKHLYDINQKNFELIGSLYEKLEEKE